MKHIALIILIAFSLGASSSGNVEYSFEASEPDVALNLAKEFLRSEGFIPAGEVDGLQEFKHYQYSIFAYLGSRKNYVYLGFTELRGGCSYQEGVPYIEKKYSNYQALLKSKGIEVSNFVAVKSANKSINYAPSAPDS
jgi:hypothetical protein